MVSIYAEDGDDSVTVSSNAGLINSQVLLYGGDGEDQLMVGRGAQSILVALNGDSGADTLASEAPALYSYAPAAYLYGGPGDDVLTGGPDAEDFFGGAAAGGAPSITNTGDDTIHGGGGNDVGWGEDGNDAVFGDEGNDLVDGGHGDDLVVGAAGDDVLDSFATVPGDEPQSLGTSSSGTDQLDGGPGRDDYFSRELPPENSIDTISCGGADGEKDDVLIGQGDIASSDCDRVAEVVSCPDTIFEPCQIEVLIDAPPQAARPLPGAHAHGERVVLAHTELRVSPGKSRTVALRMKRSAVRQALRGRKHARVREVVSVAIDGKPKSRHSRRFRLVGN
jgi:hypothetical protein